MLEELKEQVFQANLQLVKYDLVTLTWGNVSGIDRERGLVVIKPSGVAYETMRAEDMCVLTLDGVQVEGDLNPSSDTPTHLALYRAWKELGGVVHTHSPYAVAWAQAMRDLPCYGTTHADCFYGAVPCTRALSQEEIDRAYELETGNVIVSTFSERNVKPMEVPAVLCGSHGPFSWGKDPDNAVHNAYVLEQVAKMALLTLQVNPAADPAPQRIVEKHYQRKHGKNAYYGQKH